MFKLGREGAHEGQSGVFYSKGSGDFPGRVTCLVLVSVMEEVFACLGGIKVGGGGINGTVAITVV